MPDWKQCEGELAGGEFPLERYLGGSDAHAVFLTRCASGKAAIQLVPADRDQADALVAEWNRAATLVHPHLARILAAGTAAVRDMAVAYFVTEYAEESLAEVLRQRPLTATETREMLEPVADALAYLHSLGLVHGNLEPASILAIEDMVKISSDGVSPGNPAADMRALGATLIQVLRQPQESPHRAAQALPSPFREMAQGCFRDEPRWSASEIAAWVRSPEWPAWNAPAAALVAAPVVERTRRRYPVVAIAVAVIGAVIVGVLAMTHRTADPAAPTVEPARPAPTAAVVPPVPPRTGAAPVHDAPSAQDQITRRVLPDIPAQARATVHGKATVVVRVAVDRSGNVTEARLEPGGSAYFGRLTLEAVRQWQFATAEAPGHWILRFEIMRTATQVIPTRADR